LGHPRQRAAARLTQVTLGKLAARVVAQLLERRALVVEPSLQRSAADVKRLSDLLATEIRPCHTRRDQLAHETAGAGSLQRGEALVGKLLVERRQRRIAS